jgi:hypothetical protein
MGEFMGDNAGFGRKIIAKGLVKSFVDDDSVAPGLGKCIRGTCCRARNLKGPDQKVILFIDIWQFGNNGADGSIAKHGSTAGFINAA